MNSRQLAVAYGKKPYDLVLTLLQETNIASEINPEDHVLLKPNLVMAREASSGITTHPRLVEGVIRFLLEAGVKRITVAESSWTGGDTRRAFQICGYYDLVKHCLLIPAYWVLASIGAWKGLLQLLTRPSFWEKTKHGLDGRAEAARATGG